MNAVSTKVLLRFFPPVCPFASSICKGVVCKGIDKGVCNTLLGMLCEVTSAKHAILYEVMSAKHAWVSLEKIWMRQMGRLEEKNRRSTFVLAAFIAFGLFNIFPQCVTLLLFSFGEG